MSNIGFNLSGIWFEGIDSSPLILRKVTGWSDLSASKYEQQSMPGVQGNFNPGESFGEGLPITLDVRAFGKAAECEQMVASVRALRGLHALCDAAWYRPSGITRRKVEIRSVTDAHMSWQNYADFQIALLAPDPLLYGETQIISCGRPTTGDGIASPIVEPIQISAVNGLSCAWSGGINNSISMLKKDGVAIASNLVTDPAWYAHTPRTWQAKITKNGAFWDIVKNGDLTTVYPIGQKEALSALTANTDYVVVAQVSGQFSVANTFDQTKGISNYSAAIVGDYVVWQVHVDTLDSNNLFFHVDLIDASIKMGMVGVFTLAGWNTMQTLSVNVFSGSLIAFPAGSDGDPGQVSFTNAGSAATSLIMQVSGGAMSGGVRLHCVETGDVIQLDFPLLDGQILVFDSAAHRVTLNNQSSLNGYLSHDDWFDAPTGGTTTVQFEPLGDVAGNPILTLQAAPAWY